MNRMRFLSTNGHRCTIFHFEIKSNENSHRGVVISGMAHCMSAHIIEEHGLLVHFVTTGVT